MAKLPRFTGEVVPFASEAIGTERTIFGDTTQSNAIDDNLNADYKRGWGIVGVNDLPTKQDFNAMGFTLGQLLAYLYQQGVPEYDATTEYFENQITNFDGDLYKSLIDNNTGNTPDVSPSEWSNITAQTVVDATTTVKGIVELTTNAEALGGSDTTRAVTSAALASNKLYATSGYQQLPGGLIIQWGRSAPLPATANTAVTFPLTFPNNHWITVATFTDNTGVTRAVGTNVSNNALLNQVVLRNPDASPSQYNFISIGN
jgi:hypothetical protein